MTEEIMPREDRMGKILTFIGGCLAGVIGVFTVAAMSEMSSCSTISNDSDHSNNQQDESLSESYTSRA
ncbi:hypothetical protein [Desulfomicrobium apsheronum]|uniref:hypothetical protein n=1 Tax=Desulfomicrobium apsheronum TaxID=52560 RepID=UPI0011604C0A|nr:hypothetical protein [Desulfomicrobium apsheronum]